MKELFFMLIFALLYVGLMNWLGGEKHLFFNRIRKIRNDLQ